jgi:ABC-2 type transport system permease protein
MSTALAFVKRDASIAISYRVSFLLQFLTPLLTLATFYFIGEMIGPVDAVEEAGGWFPYVLIGVAGLTYQRLSMTTFSTSIREGQMMGTLEIMLLSPTRLSKILLSSSIWPYAFTSLQVVVLLLMGAIIFGVEFSNVNLPSALVMFILLIVSLSGIGIISAAFIMVLKKGDPVAWLFTGFSSLVAGVFFPPEYLPGWLEWLSKALPLTYALTGMREALYNGQGLYDLRLEILALLGFSAVLLPLAILSFRHAVRRARVEGSLIQY